MRYLRFLIPTLLLFGTGNFAFGQDSPTISPLTIGETVQLHSTTLKEDRTLNVYLPLSYTEETAANYPVIYVLDGSLNEDFIHIAGLVQFCSFPWIDLVPESIVVGVANVDRQRDFTYPTTVAIDQQDFPRAGGSTAFIEFLSQEVIPLVNKQYRTNGESMLIGQSLGGLLATEVLFRSPDLFDQYVIVSPSLWWDNGSLMDVPMQPHKEPKDVFVTVGGEDRQMVGGVLHLVSKLQEWRSMETDGSKVVHYAILPEYNHGDILHAAVHEAFKQFKIAQVQAPEDANE